MQPARCNDVSRGQLEAIAVRTVSLTPIQPLRLSVSNAVCLSPSASSLHSSSSWDDGGMVARVAMRALEDTVGMSAMWRCFRSGYRDRSSSAPSGMVMPLMFR